MDGFGATLDAQQTAGLSRPPTYLRGMLPIHAATAPSIWRPETDHSQLREAAERLLDRIELAEERSFLLWSRRESIDAERAAKILKEGKTVLAADTTLHDGGDLLEMAALTSEEFEALPEPQLAACLHKLKTDHRLGPDLFVAYNALSGDTRQGQGVSFQYDGQSYTLETRRQALDVGFLLGVDGIEVDNKVTLLSELKERGLEVGPNLIGSYFGLARGYSQTLRIDGLTLGQLAPQQEEIGLDLAQNWVTGRPFAKNSMRTPPKRSIISISGAPSRPCRS